MKTIQAEGGAAEWFIAQTSANAERLAKAHLERQGFAAYLPMRPTLSKRVDAVANVPFLPRYLFVAVDPANPRWHDIYATPGVSTLMRRSGAIDPARVPDALVQAIRVREVCGLVILAPKEKAKPPAFAKGERVKVSVPMNTDEGFAVYDALFDAQLDARRVCVLLSFAERHVRMEVGRGAVRKAG